LIPWEPGTSGNPLGGAISALGLAAEVRRRTQNGRQLVDFYMNLLEGRPIERPGRRALTPNLDHMVVAANWLSDRGYGKPKETLEVMDQSSQTQRLELLRRLSDSEREQLRALLQRALNPSPSAPASDLTNGRADGDPTIQDDDREIVLPENGTPVIEAKPVRPDFLEPTDTTPPPSTPTN
jgi:hypothetical protein